jgi:DNA excision repair protein ERCC-4
MGFGVDSVETIHSSYSITPSDMIRALPAITSRNHRYVMSQFKCMKELINASEGELQQVMGLEQGQRLYEFLNLDARVTDISSKPS